MSISDELMWRYYELLSARSSVEIDRLKQQAKEGSNPRDIKIALAEEIVSRYHGSEAAKKAHTTFIERFQQKQLPEDLEEYVIQVPDEGLGIAYVLKEKGLVSSTSDAIRMIQQGAVKIDGERVEDEKKKIAPNETHIFQVGKRRFAKIKTLRK